MREDSPEPAADARERLFLLLRRRLGMLGGFASFRREALDGHPWHASDYEGLEWIFRLAAEGHMGARRLQGRVLGAECPIPAPEWGGARLQALGEAFPEVALFLARRMIDSQEPDIPAGIRWLDRAGGWYPDLAAGLRLLYPTAGPVPEREAWIISRYLAGIAAPRSLEAHDRRETQGDLLAEVALARQKSPDGVGNDAIQLLEHAEELGSRIAQEPLWIHRFAQATDRSAFVRRWLADHPTPEESASTPSLYVGAAIERGDLGAPSGPEAAVPWYVRAMGLEQVQASEPAPYGPRMCMFIGRELEAAAKDRNGLDDGALARAWYERGIDVGSDFCFESWMKACISGRLGLRADPALALERAQRFLASGVDYARSKWLMAAILRKTHDHAVGLLEQSSASEAVSRAVAWLRLAALLEHGDSQYLLGQLHAEGRGVERDEPVAIALYRKAAAQGHAGARAALGIETPSRDPASASEPPKAKAVKSKENPARMKLELAKAYLETGDTGGAAELLAEVLQEGEPELIDEASDLIGRLIR